MAVVGCHKVPPSRTLGISGSSGTYTPRGPKQRHTLARLLAHLAYRLGLMRIFSFFSSAPPLPAFTRKSVLGDLPSFGLAVLDSFCPRY